MFSQAFSLAVWESLFPACVVRGRANLLLSFHSAAPIPLQSLSVFSLLLAVAGQQEEAPSLFHISSPLKYPLDVVLPFSYIRGRFVYCPFFLVQFKKGLRRLFCVCGRGGAPPQKGGAVARGSGRPWGKGPCPPKEGAVARGERAVSLSKRQIKNLGNLRCQGQEAVI